MIVVDTNVICYHWMASSHSPVAERALAKDPEWIAPFLWRSEFRNAIAGAILGKVIGLADATALIEKAEKQMSEREFLISSPAVMELVERSNCSAYDCEFVALALEQQVTLVTVDREVLRDFAQVAISLEEFVKN